jgi:thiosulfate/3-mercaptopyruvate sulfurtransferase
MLAAHAPTARRHLAVVTAMIACVTSTLAAQPPRADSVIVSTEWLAGRLNDPDLVVLHVASSRRDYLAGHIPGARFVWTNSFAPSTPDLATELPSIAQLDSLLESVGVSDRSRIVVYGASGPLTARLFVTLEHLGAGDRTSVLDGGLAAWRGEGRPVSMDVPQVARGQFTPKVGESIVGVDFVREAMGATGLRILDARTPEFYSGASAGGMPRAGHIPGAANIPFNTLFTETGRLKDRATLTAMFANAGVKRGDRVVTYCHVGQQASALYLVARHLGFDARMYDGSFEDWSSRTELPVAK